MVKNRSAGHYTDNYYQAVCCFAHTAALLLTLPTLPHRQKWRDGCTAGSIHVVTGDTTSRVTNGAAGAGLQGAHLMHHVHQCTMFTIAVRRLARTARATTHAMCDLVKQLRGIRSEIAYALAARGARCSQSRGVAGSDYHNLLLAPAARRDK